ncbi:MAG: phage minor head protein [Xenococcaceae cyanobacterium]
MQQTFTEQLDYFRRKKVIANSSDLRKLGSLYHDRAFSVSHLTKMDLLLDLKSLLEQSMEEGLDFEEFKKEIKDLLHSKGWNEDPQAKTLNKQRLYTIFDTNIRRSHSAGRFQQIEQSYVKEIFPYRMWVHRDSPQHRPHHKAIDGKVFLSNHEFWRHAFPPNGFGCRCGVVSLTSEQVKERGLTPTDPPDWRSFVEPGFEWAAGVNLERTSDLIEEQANEKRRTL